MSELWGQGGTAAFASQPAANDAVTAGALLRRAREAAGLHVGALAVSLKVPVRKLEALEEDRWDLLPDAVFVRALASSVCRTLKIDPQPVLERLPQTAAPRLIQSGEGMNVPFRAPSDSAGPTWIDQLSKPVFLAVFALLLGALVLILLPSVQQEAAVAATPAISLPQAATPLAPAVETAANSVSAADVAQPVEAVGTPWALSPAAVASATSASTAAPVSAAAASSPAAGADPAPAIIVFRTNNPSWVEVTDAKGVVAVRRLLAPGEAASASGALPLRVVIGRVDATEVQVRGKPFDLRAVSHDNVARFEVK